MDWGSVFHEVQHAETVDNILVNTGLAYLPSFAWRAFLDSDDVVEAVDLHPAVETVARILRADPNAGDLAALARAARLSSSNLSRIFKDQTGVSISRFRNQQRLQRFLRLYGKGRRTTALAAALGAGRVRVRRAVAMADELMCKLMTLSREIRAAIGSRNARGHAKDGARKFSLTQSTCGEALRNGKGGAMQPLRRLSAVALVSALSILGVAASATPRSEN